MAKRKSDTPTDTVPPVPHAPEIADTEEPVEPPAKRPTPTELAPKWSFPTVSRCPRCHTEDNVCTGTHDGIQYRECRHSWCKTVLGKGQAMRFKVAGTQV